jgi:hypothetical protein
MTWIPLLLADPSPCLRWLVLRELMQRPDNDPEVLELTALRQSDPLVADLLAAQAADGSWSSSPGYPLRDTALALMRLGYLGFGSDLAAVAAGAEFLFAQQRSSGAWPMPKARAAREASEGYDMVPLQTAIPLRGLAACGYATDVRAERAYEWLLAQRLDDGSWPTGTASGTLGYVAGYRRLAHSRWGCRSNTTGALTCLALHPTRRNESEARRALDLLLGRETREAHTLGFEIARLLGAEPARGFFTFYARFDLAQILDLCRRVGAGQGDERVAEAIEFVLGLRGEYGLWQQGSRPQLSRWLTFDLLRSMAHLHERGASDWVSAEPRTPFQAYARTKRRY